MNSLPLSQVLLMSWRCSGEKHQHIWDSVTFYPATFSQRGFLLLAPCDTETGMNDHRYFPEQADSTSARLGL